MSQSKHVATYVSEEQFERWQEEAEMMRMSTSEWVNAMVEAGQKKFDRDIRPDESKDDLRRRNTGLWQKYQKVREERDHLEDQLLQTERQAIVEYVDESQGCRYKEIARHLSKNRGSRLTRLLDALDGEEIEIDEEGRVYRL